MIMTIEHGIDDLDEMEQDILASTYQDALELGDSKEEAAEAAWRAVQGSVGKEETMDNIVSVMKDEHRAHTPIVSERQRGLFGSELARRRKGEEGKMPGITEDELEGHLRESGGKKLPASKSAEKDAAAMATFLGSEPTEDELQLQGQKQIARGLLDRTTKDRQPYVMDSADREKSFIQKARDILKPPFCTKCGLRKSLCKCQKESYVPFAGSRDLKLLGPMAGNLKKKLSKSADKPETESGAGHRPKMNPLSAKMRERGQTADDPISLPPDAGDESRGKRRQIGDRLAGNAPVKIVGQ
jgi:hypothetical protein